MYFVYILKSQKQSDKFYIGITINIANRLKEHNECPTCSYTKSYGPWIIGSYIAVQEKILAEKLERYLKHGSGHAFLKKHLI